MFLVLKTISPAYPAKISSLGFLAHRHRWAHVLKKQSSILFIVCLPRKTNFRFPFPFAAYEGKFAISIFCFKQTNRNCRFPLVLFFMCKGMCVSVCEGVCIYAHLHVYIFINYLYLYLY
jgi:hypothetical protein